MLMIWKSRKTRRAVSIHIDWPHWFQLVSERSCFCFVFLFLLLQKSKVHTLIILWEGWGVIGGNRFIKASSQECGGKSLPQIYLVGSQHGFMEGEGDCPERQWAGGPCSGQSLLCPSVCLLSSSLLGTTQRVFLAASEREPLKVSFQPKAS